MRTESTRYAEVILGRVRVVREIQVDHGAPYTKWDFLTDAERKELDAAPFKDGDGSCGRCGEALPTEGHFARHYVIPDLRYLNLGCCPTW